jgi:UPF0755 protein
MTKAIVYLILTGIVLSVAGYFGFNFYSQFYGVPGDIPTGEYTFQVESGDTLSQVGAKLEEDNVINSTTGLVWMERFNPISALQEGEYKIVLNQDDPVSILDKIDEESRRIQAVKAEAAKRPAVTVTFKEGEPLDEVMFKLDQAGVTDYEELAKFAKNPENFDRETYEFLPEPLDCEYGDIKKCAKYYPEGYLYPDTYQFFEDSTPEEAFNRMLSNFNTRVWQNVKDDVGDRDFHEVMILASVLEKETGRPAKGVSDANRAEVNEERRNMAQVFYNRNEIGMKWQSDITAEYGQFEVDTEKGEFTKRKLCQQTFRIENCIALINNPDIENLYNGYYISGFPVGPMTNPQFDNVFAALNPIDNNYLFFVSDLTGKKYFSSSDAEHQATIVRVQGINAELEAAAN